MAYNGKRTRNIFDPLQHGSEKSGGKSFKISRSKIELFLQCPRCFYLDRRLGVGRPQGPPFTLNSAVDTLLKHEFDTHRLNGTQPELLQRYSVKARPIPHEQLDDWRENFVGVQYLHVPTNLIITGAIDDLWQDEEGKYVVVDYKATAKAEPVTALEDKPWHDGYKRQMEIYQWLLRQNGYDVSSLGYFLYCTGKLDGAAFDGKLEFELTLISYEGNANWVDGAITDLKACLMSDEIPVAAEGCEYCTYRQAVTAAETSG